MTVIAFKSDSSFKPFKPLYNGKPGNFAGYFQQGQDENIIALDVTANSEHPMSIIYHEYTHFLTSREPREWPAWLMEGIAEVYSSFDVGKDSVILGAPISDHVLRLREQFMPLDTLLKVDHKSPIYNEGNKQTIFYAESWALTHYFMFGDKSARQSQLVQFLTLYSNGMDEDKALAQAFKTDHAALQKALQRYVQNNSYSAVNYHLNANDVQPEMNLSVLSDAEAQYYLGDLLLQTNRPQDAVAYFKQAESLDPNLSRAYEGLGFVAMRNGNFSEAVPQFKLAVEHGSQNYLAHYYYAEALDRLAYGSGSGILEGDLANTVTAELKKAIELAPSFANAHYLLAQMYMMSGEHIDEGLKSINTAIKLDPRNKHFFLVLAQLKLRNGDYDEAKKILTPLASDSDASLREPAGHILQQVDSYLSYKRGGVEAPAQSGGSQTADAPSAGPGRPTLKRKDGSGPDESPDSASKGNDSSPDNGTAVDAEQAAAGRPSLNIEGTGIFEGTLQSIQCGRGIVLVGLKDGKTFKFSVTQSSQLRFLSHNPAGRRPMGCGPVNLPAFIYYKPAPAGQKDIAGEAVTVEFPRRQSR